VRKREKEREGGKKIRRNNNNNKRAKRRDSDTKASRVRKCSKTGDMQPMRGS